MVAKNRLQCLFFSDLLSWERSAVEPILEVLSQNQEVQSQDVTEADRGLLKKLEPGITYWILAKNWRHALAFLGVRSQIANSVYVSIFELSSPRTSIYQLAAKRLFSSIPKGVTLLTHSPLNYRFFTEMEGLPPSRVQMLLFPFQNKITKKGDVPKENLTVGTFAPFITESNLNYFLGVAHYLVHKKPGTRFLFLGTGPLYSHLSQMVIDLELTESVEIVETNHLQDIAELDIFLYSPLRNNHFLPLLFAASLAIPVLASELTGIEDFIVDGHTGFLVPMHETKPMSELVLRLLQDEILRHSIGQQLKGTLKEKFSTQFLLRSYEAFFSNGKKTKEILDKAA